MKEDAKMERCCWFFGEGDDGVVFCCFLVFDLKENKNGGAIFCKKGDIYIRDFRGEGITKQKNSFLTPSPYESEQCREGVREFEQCWVLLSPCVHPRKT